MEWGSIMAWKGEGLWAVRRWPHAEHTRLLSEVGEMSILLTPCFSKVSQQPRLTLCHIVPF